MLKKIFTFLIVALSTVVVPQLNASSLSIELTDAGQLEYMVENPAEVTSLSVKGEIDAADFYFISNKMTALVSLDLSGATIVAMHGANIDGRLSFPAATIPSGVFAGASIKDVVFPTGQSVTIGDGAFAGTAFESVELPENIDSIGTGAFAACPQLKNVVFPATQRVGESVFAECPMLETVNLKGAVRIPAGTFRGCTALAEVTNAENVAYIGDRAFEGDRALTSFDFGNKLTYLGTEAFAASGLEEVNLSTSGNVKVINDRAFAHADVKSVALPENLNELGEAAFFGSTQIADLQLPSTVIRLGSASLVGTTLPSDVVLPSDLEEIGDYALAGQTGVQRITLPSGLIYIGSHGMEGMTSLTNIYASALTHVPELGENVWEGINPKEVTLTVHDDHVEDFKNADQWKEFKLEDATIRDEIMNDANGNSGIYGRFVGNDLEIESKGADIATVRLYDTSGRLLTTAETSSQKVTVDTSAFTGNIFIVNVTLADGINATLKAARR